MWRQFYTHRPEIFFEGPSGHKDFSHSARSVNIYRNGMQMEWDAWNVGGCYAT